MTKNKDSIQTDPELIRDLIGKTNDAIFVNDPKTGRFIFVNDRACAGLGYDRQELLGMGVKDIETTFPDNFSWQTHVDELRQRGRLVLEGIHKRKNGTTFPVETNVSYVVLNTREYMVAVVRDITERKRMEDALQQSEKRYRQLFENMHEGFLIQDIVEDDAGKPVDVRYLDINPAIERFLGKPRAEIIGRTRNQVLGSPDPAVVDAISRVAATGQPIHMVRYSSGARRWYESISYPLRQGQVATLVLDITERKQAEEALKESEKSLRESQAIAGLGSYVLDVPSGFWTSSDVLDNLFGIDAAYVRSVEGWEALIHPDDRAMMAGYFKNEVLGRGEAFDKEYRIIRRDDRSERWVHGSGKLEFDGNGRPLKMRGTIQDITDRKKLEEQLRQTQKLESIGTLAGGIAHDFNNLLQGIFGYISLAKMTIDQKERSLSMLDQAEEALHMSVNLTTQLLTFSKGGQPVKKLIRVRPAVENAVKFALSGSRTNYEMDIPADVWSVEADEGQLAQVIQNIVLNANEAMAGSGTVRVSVANVDIAKDAITGLPEGGRFVRITIEDSGIGIPEQNLARIFDPYFTTKQKGSGLGLATSYSIIKKHGGVIEVQSALNRGTTFTIYLPASNGAETGTARTVSNSAGTKKGRILLMDDEELVRNVARDMLAALGHEVVSAEDGRKAIELFRQARADGTPFDLVILDLTVKGGMGGEEAMRNIRGMDPGAKAVVASGYADSPVIADYRAYGFSAVLNKPYRIEAMQECLKLLVS